ncbi:MAG: hypothetical protein AB8B87_09490 [Granulosicoccus sp.]
MRLPKERDASLSRSKKLWLIALFLSVICLFLVLFTLVINDYFFLKDKFTNDRMVRNVSGHIQTVKYYHGGRSGEALKLRVSGLKKWVLIGKVKNEEESTYFVKNNKIEVEVYQLPNNILRRKYIQKHTLQSLGVKVNNKVLRSSENAKSTVIRNHLLILAVIVFVLFTVFFGLYKISKTPIKNSRVSDD